MSFKVTLQLNLLLDRGRYTNFALFSLCLNENILAPSRFLYQSRFFDRAEFADAGKLTLRI